MLKVELSAKEGDLEFNFGDCIKVDYSEETKFFFIIQCAGYKMICLEVHEDENPRFSNRWNDPMEVSNPITLDQLKIYCKSLNYGDVLSIKKVDCNISVNIKF